MKITEKRPEVTYNIELSQVELNTIAIALESISHTDLDDLSVGVCSVLDSESLFELWSNLHESVK